MFGLSFLVTNKFALVLIKMYQFWVDYLLLLRWGCLRVFIFCFCNYKHCWNVCLFVQVPGPDPSRIPDHDVVGVTIVLITCSYREKEFIRVGYYVSNSYSDPEMLENPPEKPKYELVQNYFVLTKSNTKITSNEFLEDYKIHLL